MDARTKYQSRYCCAWCLCIWRSIQQNKIRIYYQNYYFYVCAAFALVHEGFMNIKSSKKKNIWKMRYVRLTDTKTELQKFCDIRICAPIALVLTSHISYFSARKPRYPIHAISYSWLGALVVNNFNRYFRLWRRVAAGNVYSEPVRMNVPATPLDVWNSPHTCTQFLLQYSGSPRTTVCMRTGAAIL